MATAHDDDVINQHAGKIRSLALRAMQGQYVRASVNTAVSEALKHFAGLQSGRSANIVAFKWRITMMATHASQPAQKAILEYAASLIA